MNTEELLENIGYMILVLCAFPLGFILTKFLLLISIQPVIPLGPIMWR